VTSNPLDPSFNDAARKTTPTSKSNFNQAADPIGHKAARVTEIAEAHFEKHRASWVAARYGDLLRTDSPAPSLKPEGSRSDRTAHLLRTANHLVDRKQQARLNRIKSVESQMRKGCFQGLEK